MPFIITNVLEGDYRWALGLFVAAGISDGLDGLLARLLKQKTVIGQYLDPIADKLLLSSLFLVLSFTHRVPWKYTVLVFSRDVCILAVAAVLYNAASVRDFRPSIFGKVNTFSQVGAVFFVLLEDVVSSPYVAHLRTFFLYATFAFTFISGVHYIARISVQLRELNRSAAAR